MSKYLTRIGALVIVLLLVTACAGGDSAATRDFVEPPSGEWDAPYDKPVQILAVAPQGSNWYFRDGDDISNNPWTRLYKEELNIRTILFE